MLGSDQDISTGVFALLIKELKKISFPITHVNQLRLRHSASEFHQFAMMLDPDKGLFFLDRDL